MPLSLRAYNGSETRFRYDALGRLTAVFQPGDAENEPTTTYDYRVEGPLSRIVTTARVGRGLPDERSDLDSRWTIRNGVPSNGFHGSSCAAGGGCAG